MNYNMQTTKIRKGNMNYLATLSVIAVLAILVSLIGESIDQGNELKRFKENCKIDGLEIHESRLVTYCKPKESDVRIFE
jgi:hypothetical protein